MQKPKGTWTHCFLLNVSLSCQRQCLSKVGGKKELKEDSKKNNTWLFVIVIVHRPYPKQQPFPYTRPIFTLAGLTDKLVPPPAIG